MDTTIKTVGVVGTGVIGSSWILLFLAHGLRVVVTDPAPNAETKLKEYIDEHWSTSSRLGLHSSASKSNYTFVNDIAPELPSLDFIQENAPERIELKRKLLASLEEGLRPDVVIASSSSGLPSSQLIENCKHPERVLIGHPFNPPHLMPLVELVPHPGTAPESVQQAQKFYTSLGKTPIVIKQETPGFIGNRLQAVLCHEAWSLVSRGVVSAKDLDAAVTSGVGLRWAAVGPFMTGALGGGGGVEGFKHMFEHLGPAMESWAADGRKHDFDINDAETKQKLFHSINEMLEETDKESVEKARDDLLINIITDKKNGQ